jgi:hypothetical protein
MPAGVTLGLGLIALGAIVYFVGVDSTKTAATKAGGTVRNNVNRSVALGAGGALAGLQFGDQLVSAIITDPGFALTAVAGVMGALGIEGYLGEISGLQFLLIGFVAFVVGYSLFGGGD